MKSLVFLSLLITLALCSCSKIELTPPPDEFGQYLNNTTPLADSVMARMEGVYTLAEGSQSLGTHFVCKTSRSRVSFFSNTDGIFFILNFGYHAADSSIRFAGFWRYSENSTQGNILMSIPAGEGASDLLAGIVSSLTLYGNFSSTSLTLRYDHPFSSYAIANPFMIFGHHGVMTTANPPFAENSLNAVLQAEHYGVNGLEFDVRLTSDHVPICIHDATINTRLTNKGPLSGDWDQYPFPVISAFIRLHDGQKIPSLDEALTTFIDSSDMKYFWMDVKGNAEVFRYLEPIVRNAYARAAALGRDIVIIAGMPSDEVIEQFHQQPSYSTLPTLCEDRDATSPRSRLRGGRSRTSIARFPVPGGACRSIRTRRRRRRR